LLFKILLIRNVEDGPTIKTPADAFPCCGGRMIVIETFEPGLEPRYRPTTPTIDTS
jgi:hypothetical protein